MAAAAFCAKPDLVSVRGVLSACLPRRGPRGRGGGAPPFWSAVSWVRARASAEDGQPSARVAYAGGQRVQHEGRQPLASHAYAAEHAARQSRLTPSAWRRGGPKSPPPPEARLRLASPLPSAADGLTGTSLVAPTSPPPPEETVFLASAEEGRGTASCPRAGKRSATQHTARTAPWHRRCRNRPGPQTCARATERQPGTLLSAIDGP